MCVYMYVCARTKHRQLGVGHAHVLIYVHISIYMCVYMYVSARTKHRQLGVGHAHVLLVALRIHGGLALG